MIKYVYDFSEGSSDMKALLGGKGANLAQMVKEGLAVPPGFTVTTEACLRYLEEGREFVQSLWIDVETALERLESQTGRTFGSGPEPLLVSVRSGAPISMPGMMDTILNLGLNDDTRSALAEMVGDDRFAWDSYRRFIQMFGNVVKGVPSERFESILEEVRRNKGVALDHQLDAEALASLVKRYLSLYEEVTGETFPSDPWIQLREAVEAVFDSWNTARAKTYRKIHGIDDSMGTAVNVVAMVYGNLGGDSGTGVCFSRNPADGEKKLYGEFLVNAQGEDVVAGIRTPQPIGELTRVMPEIFEELKATADRLERRFKDMQDIEFTVERGKLYILQTRTGKRSAEAAVRIAVEMEKEGLIDRNEALGRISPEQVERLLHSQIDPNCVPDVISRGLPASPGAAVGRIVFDPDEAVAMAEKGESVVLVRPETTPDDIHGLYAAKGILTSRGGMTSHAAVVARGLGKPCVSGAEDVSIDLEGGRLLTEDREFVKGDFITVDGSTGRVIAGEVPLSLPSISDELNTVLDWADEAADLQVWANGDTPEDAKRARSFGAKGIGLCRTEHMFMAEDRFPVMQRMVVAESLEERQEALDDLRAMQVEDFVGIFREMDGLPVIVRLLDPPLHEFLPKIPELDKRIVEADSAGYDTSKLRKMKSRAESLREVNPMLGFRGCRLGIVYPEIYGMQIRAIFDAMSSLPDVNLKVEIMMPLVQTKGEMALLREMVDSIASEYPQASLSYLVGTMIELPRAALRAAELAEDAEFFSFGTNDLTQTCLGLSRDDVESKFMKEYVDKGIFPISPFHVLDRDGVGELMAIAFERGRKARPDISIGICGEHGGDPKSVAFCHSLGLNYVSCSPFRVPVARMAAGWAALGLIE
ncbi:pyruvate, phosphate dikinase [Dethiosulfovibrio peptidovorans DSM 11002]|uniref:Pyruvate, phosphate dikinase n=1 Tax=Dethiosulfovibrio peptidovorans DSM 11002 TaxID=469381 RepID=D2Z6U2_9BACT|nr:pyruvate, phosphate dikinase [Dethiosulfovibrio peptidovorans]EFC91189.1 pyruvate, phosphate dikinase [Dethiosulfovibrio peptidovorans DSM 11002]